MFKACLSSFQFLRVSKFKFYLSFIHNFFVFVHFLHNISILSHLHSSFISFFLYLLLLFPLSPFSFLSFLALSSSPILFFTLFSIPHSSLYHSFFLLFQFISHYLSSPLFISFLTLLSLSPVSLFLSHSTLTPYPFLRTLPLLSHYFTTFQCFIPSSLLLPALSFPHSASSPTSSLLILCSSTTTHFLLSLSHSSLLFPFLFYSFPPSLIFTLAHSFLYPSVLLLSHFLTHSSLSYSILLVPPSILPMQFILLFSPSILPSLFSSSLSLFIPATSLLPHKLYLV